MQEAYWRQEEHLGDREKAARVYRARLSQKLQQQHSSSEASSRPSSVGQEQAVCTGDIGVPQRTSSDDESNS